ncbi:MAG: papain fold toxin domain-containing protein [Nostoc sp. CreGUA01]|nr:papain fold toxin domain-containing protein [Nostoc sp. CreGUA01]
MSELSPQEVYYAISTIVVKFPLLECDKCAKAVMQWLAKNSIEGKIIQLRTKRRNEVFITSDRWNPNDQLPKMELTME